MQKAYSWFEKEFGFKESNYSFLEIRDQFNLSSNEENIILQSKHNNRTFSVGKFEMPSIKELQKQYEILLNSPKVPKDSQLKSPTMPKYSQIKDSKFPEIVSSVEDLIKDEKNEDAVFQVASQFNCLEMPGPSITPEKGITGYEWDHTQGPACALSCPAATLYRNYFLSFDSTLNLSKQVNLLEDVEDLPEINNKENNYWYIQNGYCMAGNQFWKLGPLLEKDKEIQAKIIENLKIGIQWNTEVSDRKHKVTQVFCSALPISYNRQSDEKWETFARLVLEGYYKGCLLVGAISALKNNKEKVKVFLTMLGGGVFGNNGRWIEEAMEKSVGIVDENLVEVVVVKFGSSKNAMSGWF